MEKEDKIMEYIISSEHQKNSFFAYVNERIRGNTTACVKYICLNNTTVRVICHTQSILPLLRQQFTYTLKDTAKKYDATILVWHEPEPRYFLAALDVR